MILSRLIAEDTSLKEFSSFIPLFFVKLDLSYKKDFFKKSKLLF